MRHMKYCEHCGGLNLDKAAFCVTCGKRIHTPTVIDAPPTTPPPETTPQPDTPPAISQPHSESLSASPPPRGFKKIHIAVIAIAVVVSLAVVATLYLSATDYSAYYNTHQGTWVVEKPFYKTTSPRGNDLYVGVIRNATSLYSATVSYEHVKTQSEAANIFADTIANAKASGAHTGSTSKGSNVADEWGGTTSMGAMYVSYYQASYGGGTGSFWVVQTNTAGSL